MKPTICPYCGGAVKFKDSKVIYGESYGMVYICEHYPKCDAFVGVHKGTKKSLGRLANAELREWKKKAHRNFDPLWKYRQFKTGSKMSRSHGYTWLASKMNLNLESCHIGMFNVEDCMKVVDICVEVYKARPAIKQYAKNLYAK